MLRRKKFDLSRFFFVAAVPEGTLADIAGIRNLRVSRFQPD